jgi:hypothetical protein
MTHCSDDDLVLEYYGEAPDASAHVAACAACAGRARDLAVVMSSIDVDDAVPDRGVEYGSEVWARVESHLDDRGPVQLNDRGARLVSLADTGPTLPQAQGQPEQSRGMATPAPRRPFVRWGLAAAATIALVGSAFLAGRLSVQPGRAPTAPASAAADAADPQLARRVLLMSVTDHLERSDRVLTDIMNAPEADIAIEQQWAADLVAANRLYRQDAIDANEASVADVLDELERTLLDVVHRPSDAPADLDQIRRRIDSAALLFKVRVLTNELRQRELAPDTPTSAANPIS